MFTHMNKHTLLFIYVTFHFYIKMTHASIACFAKVFCFGDSLTSGSSPPFVESFPYGPHLEKAIRTASGKEDSMVRWKGYPGWTASNLLQEGGLGALLDDIQFKTGTHVDLVIILAGTNDLAYEKNPDIVFKDIKSIHDVAHGRNIHTLAIGVPDSAWQQQSVETANVAREVNAKLQEWSDTHSDLVDYEPFPIAKFDPNSGYWAPDGLHFSPQGYQYLGENIAPKVTTILSNIPRL